MLQGEVCLTKGRRSSVPRRLFGDCLEMPWLEAKAFRALARRQRIWPSRKNALLLRRDMNSLIYSKTFSYLSDVVWDVTPPKILEGLSCILHCNPVKDLLMLVVLFILVTGEDRYYIFSKGTYKVGRKGCDVIVNKDKGVSRIHAEIVVDVMSSLEHLQNKSSNISSNVRIRDCSKYGTFISKNLGAKEKVHEFPNKEATLKDGDLVSFGTGNATYRFCFVPLMFLVYSSEPFKVNQLLEEKILSIGACMTCNWSPDCTHVLVYQFMPLTEDVIDPFVAKKHFVLKEWIEYNFKNKLWSLLEMVGAKVVSIEGYCSNNQILVAQSGGRGRGRSRSGGGDTWSIQSLEDDSVNQVMVHAEPTMEKLEETNYKKINMIKVVVKRQTYTWVISATARVMVCILVCLHSPDKEIISSDSFWKRVIFSVARTILGTAESLGSRAPWGLEDEEDKRVVLVIPPGLADKFVSSRNLSSLSRVKEKDLICAAFSAHLDPSVMVAAPVSDECHVMSVSDMVSDTVVLEKRKS
ncbi:hypothetical protein TEA_003155 [Camellia sinensis var. sinensis]|uniref:FHA domain-containing protein n=1 Tax=Camellia sinensis var. sinensis TaxID=542762 RepID=A0A4S4DIF0_CAMSN|nr:hypothetical protein TEA_003155 [Camellia sinensis var. sinensis]